MIILRLKYKKEQNMKFLSHLELIKTVERIFRRMQLPMVFSQGFSPKPKINYAAPLPVGVSSECDYLDVELTEKIDIKELIETQGPYMPKGLTFVEGKYFDKTKSLMSIVTDSAYLVEIETQVAYEKAQVEDLVSKFLGMETIEYQKLNKKKKLKTIDIKPLIQAVDLLAVQDKKIIFKVLVTTGSNGNLKPEKLMELFIEKMAVDAVPMKEQYKRLSLYARDKNNKLIDLFEV